VRLQAELSAKHSYREAARLLTTLLPCGPMSHATMRNRTHRVAADLEQMAATRPHREPKVDPAAEIMVLIDGAHIRAWWHISIRVQHIERALRGIYALHPQHRAGLEMVEWRIGRLRHLIWNRYHDEDHDELFGMRHMASEVAYLNGEKFCPAVARLLWNCDDLRRYLANNTSSLITYAEPYRSKLPISTSRAEGCVDEIANARMAKKQRMRWSPRGAHCVAVVRAAVSDGRLKMPTDLQVAA